MIRTGALYGFERLEALVAALPCDLDVGELVQRILDEVLAFADSAEPHDDITIIAIRPAARAPLARADLDETPATATLGR